MAKKKEKPLYDTNGRWAEERQKVIGAIRRLFRQSPQFKEIIHSSRLEVDVFKKDGTLSKKKGVLRECENCGKMFPTGNIAVDHIEPFCPLYLTNNDLTNDEVIEGIICSKDNLQRLCSPKKGKKPAFLEYCHQKKTHKESFFRNKWKELQEARGTITREEKQKLYDSMKNELHPVWEAEYPVYVAQKKEEIRLKELRKQARLNKKKKE